MRVTFNLTNAMERENIRNLIEQIEELLKSPKGKVVNFQRKKIFGNRRWTSKDTQYLKNNAGKKPVYVISRHLHRTPKAIYLRASFENISVRSN